ncbi:hypothetical protein CIL03_04870 [Virgibacillus indicus]|uniref:Uncharacterized protein n=1 Tax=Virgibacillus indicus TaxID=2024554 RepID=A0A265NEL8_9BACI|nr:hypothetical protein CIL03_04870 [Virgibacillus indicus]
MVLISWINLSNSSFLGEGDNYISYVLIFAGIIVSFILLKPLISWLINSGFVLLVNYIISSLAVIVLLFIVVFFLTDTQLSVNNLLKITLQSLAAFGIVMILYYGFQKVTKKI